MKKGNHLIAVLLIAGIALAARGRRPRRRPARKAPGSPCWSRS